MTEFASRYEALYGPKHLTCNLHMTRHLVESTRNIGPLYNISCFKFEDINGKFKKFVHSSNHPEKQIINGISSHLNTYILRNENLTPGSEPYEFCNRILYPKKQKKQKNKWFKLHGWHFQNSNQFTGNVQKSSSK